jgi:hypothetical protein
VTLKCHPERARQLREQYRSVAPGYHVDKRLWNTIGLDGDVPDDDLLDLVHHSYEQVVAGLPMIAEGPSRGIAITDGRHDHLTALLTEELAALSSAGG